MHWGQHRLCSKSPLFWKSAQIMRLHSHIPSRRKKVASHFASFLWELKIANNIHTEQNNFSPSERQEHNQHQHLRSATLPSSVINVLGQDGTWLLETSSTRVWNNETFPAGLHQCLTFGFFISIRTRTSAMIGISTPLRLDFHQSVRNTQPVRWEWCDCYSSSWIGWLNWVDWVDCVHLILFSIFLSVRRPRWTELVHTFFILWWFEIWGNGSASRSVGRMDTNHLEMAYILLSRRVRRRSCFICHLWKI